MIFDRGQHPRERNGTQGAACLVDGCGGLLDIYVPAGPLVPVPGTTVIRCTRCGTVETAAMREADRCRCIVCNQKVPPRERPGGSKKRYCSAECRNEATRRINQRRREEARIGKAKQLRRMYAERGEAMDRELARARGEVAA